MIAMSVPNSQRGVSDDELVTGEAVALDVRPASFVLRAAGGAIDWVIYCGSYVLLLLWLFSIASAVELDGAITRALAVGFLAFSFVVLPTAVEMLTRGRSVGKLVIGARIVRDDGGAISLRHAFVRGLTGFVEIYATAGGLAVVVALLNSRAKRLGDLLAGTYSQHERVPKPLSQARSLPYELAGWAQIADVGRLPDRLARRIAQFLAQAPRLSPGTRARLAAELAGEAAPFVSPLPAVHPEVFIAGVAVLRRDREYAALQLEKARLARLDPILGGLPHGFPDR
jgi:uncharacterized RDD family membrane protein YckC